MKYSLVPKLLDKNKPEDSAAYKTVEDLNSALLEGEEAGVRNIALTGPYGSGKSSIIKTLIHDFKNNRKITFPGLHSSEIRSFIKKLLQNFKNKRKYLTISLATLKSEDDLPPNENEEVDKKKESLNRRIEYSILQQLIYKEKISKVPNSRFKRITHFAKWELILYSLMTLVFIISFFIALEPKFARIDSFYNHFNFGKDNFWYDLGAVIYMLLCIVFLLIYVIRAYSNSKLNKLNLKDGEIDIKEDTSIFNKHLDEIIYFFKATKYNIVIIEDLDRFENPDIFLKLRELNQTINESNDIKRHITFVYAVKDDIFINEDRTKFFDYIIPIIPVINPSNSKAILKKELSEAGLKDGEISDDDIAGIAFFIQDMRILQNIVHEFSDYREKLSKSEQHLNPTKLLAMIVYKNYHPKDFSLLHKRKGQVYKCITYKEHFIDLISEELNRKKQELLIKKEQLLQNNKLDIQDLRRLFLHELRKSLSYGAVLDSIRIGNDYRKLESIATNEEYFTELLNQSEILYRYYYSYYTNANTRNASEKINVLDNYNKSKYKAKIDYIINDTDTKIKNELNDLDERINNLSASPLSSILSNKTVKNSEIFLNIGLSEMMEVFLIEGYLDEDYYDYISYFYPGMISPADREYLMGIKRLKKPNYFQHIDKIENFVKELRPINFENESILNIELLDFLVKNKRKDSIYEKYLSLFKSLILKEEYNLSFLASHYKNSKYGNFFFESFLHENDNIKRIWDIITFNTPEEEFLLIECILKYGGKLNDKIFNWIATNFKFIRINKEKIGTDRIDYIIRTVKFKYLDLEDYQLISKINNNNAYLINQNNLTVILSLFNRDKEINEEDLSFDLILNCSTSQTREYLLSEGNLLTTYNSLNSKYKHESLESIEFILNTSLKDEEKLDYLTGQQNKRSNLDSLDDNNKKILIKSNILLPNWENVNSIYETFKNEENILTDYIKANKEILSQPNSAIGISEEGVIFDILFGNNEILTNDEYERLIKAFDVSCAGEDYIPKLNTFRFNILLNNKCLAFNQENLDIISSSNHYSDFLIYHHSKFIEHIDWNYSLSLPVILDLLSSDKFSVREKNLILDKIGFKEISQNPQLSTLAAQIIAKNLPETKFTISEIRGIISNSSDLTSNIQLVNYILPSEDLDENDVVDILKSLNRDKISKIADRKEKPKLKKIPLLITFLKALEKKHFISSTSDNEEYIWPNYFRNSN